MTDNKAPRVYGVMISDNKNGIGLPIGNAEPNAYVIHKDDYDKLQAELDEARAELDRKEKLLHEMWNHTMDRDWPVVKLEKQLADAKAQIAELEEKLNGK